MNCECFKNVNELLKEHGLKLKTEIIKKHKDGMFLVSEDIKIPLQKLEGKGKPSMSHIDMSFCPFCGKEQAE